MDMAILAAIVVAALILFVTRIVAIEVTCILIVVSLTLTGILTPPEALVGFSSPATITVAAMFILSAGLARTGVVQHLVNLLNNHGSRRLPMLLLQIGIMVAIFSAFANNTPVVVLMVPVLLSYCRTCRFASSKVFLPLSYFAILGGTCTLIGTSTNILIDDLYRASDRRRRSASASRRARAGRLAGHGQRPDRRGCRSDGPPVGEDAPGPGYHGPRGRHGGHLRASAGNRRFGGSLPDADHPVSTA